MALMPTSGDKLRDDLTVDEVRTAMAEKYGDDHIIYQTDPENTYDIYREAYLKDGYKIQGPSDLDETSRFVGCFVRDDVPDVYWVAALCDEDELGQEKMPWPVPELYLFFKMCGIPVGGAVFMDAIVASELVDLGKDKDDNSTLKMGAFAIHKGNWSSPKAEIVRLLSALGGE